MDFNQLHTTYDYFFDYYEHPRHWESHRYGSSFFMSIDAEWYEYGGRNIVLSYQIATTSRHKTNNIIIFMEHGKRLTLAEIVEHGIKSVTTPEERTNISRSKIGVALISHNLVAEWSVLADRDEPHITKRLSLVRNSPITDGHAIKLVVDSTLRVEVQMFDTMLLAPASHKSLKKLSFLLGDKEQEKETITQFYIEHMNLYLQDHPEKFIQYALKDSAVTLQLFFVLQESLNMLVIGKDFVLQESLNKLVVDKNFKLYRTLASAGVTGFLVKNEWYESYKQIPIQKEFYKAYQLVKRSYYGGRNEGYFIGQTADYPATKDKIWVDIDFSGCYPTTMALCPKLNAAGVVDYIPYSHELTDEKIAKLTKENIDPKILTTVREALDRSPEAFDTALAALPAKLSWKIRKEATKVDNRLIDKWYGQWQTAQKNGDTSLEKYIIPGFARVRFKFSADTQFPCLPIRDERFGLLYLLEGETTVTAAEIILAKEAGVEVLEALTSVELPMDTDHTGAPIRFTLSHLAKLTKERNKYKPKKSDSESQIKEKLIKEFVNSFYGKFSQAINPRKVFNPSKSEMKTLGKSSITEPCTAALITSLARAALSATLIGIEKFNKDRKEQKDQITVISATTDGLLIGLPAKKSFKEVKKYYEDKDGVPQLKGEAEKALPKILKQLGCAGVMDEINRFMSIRQMRNSRKELTGKNEIFEIKHLADQVISIKTRGQIGLLNSGHTSLLARFNLKPPLSEVIKDPEEYKRVMETGGVVRDTEDTKWIMEHYNNIKKGLDKIETYPFITLNSFTKIYKSNGTKDLTKQISQRKINMDFDWKRKLTWEKDEEGEDSDKISPFTVPHINRSAMFLHRDQMEAIRRTGYIARPEQILHRVKIQGSTIRRRGGEPVTVTRQFLRGVTQQKISLCGGKLTEAAMSAKIHEVWKELKLEENYPKDWSVNDVKNAKRALWESGCILPNILLEQLVAKLATACNADPAEARAAIFYLQDSEETHHKLVAQVISAVNHAHLMGIEPFVTLHQTHQLPDYEKLRAAFLHKMTEEQIEYSANKQFIPGKIASGELKKLKRLFYTLGIPLKQAEECAKVIAPPVAPLKKNRRNPGEKKCTEHFTLAVMQPDIELETETKTTLLDKLKKFGLSRTRYYELKKNGTFHPNSISDTHSNRLQIRQMAKALNRDPEPLLQLLICK